MKKYTILLLLSLVFVSGCWSSFDFVCGSFDEPAHCVQWLAVQDENPDECDKVPVKKDFENTGSNPPKDKCYLMIAENTGDTSSCDRIEGGMYSYTVEECYSNAAEKHDDADLCKGSPNEIECRNYLGQKTGNCGTGYEYDSSSSRCVKMEKDPDDLDDDSNCPKGEIFQKCESSNRLRMCDEGKVSYKNCEFGCFEAECRKQKGETDIPEVKEEDKEDSSTSDKEETTAGEKETSAENDKESDTDEKEDQAEDEEDEEEEDADEEEEEDEKAECERDSDCDIFEACKLGVCVEEDECEKDADCFWGEKCDSGKCVPGPECDKDTEYCGSSQELVFCENEKLKSKSCEFGCNDDRCMTEKEKEELDKEKEEEEGCKDGYAKCLSDTRIEYCADGKKSEGLCEFGCKKGECLPEVKCPWYNPWCDKEGDSQVVDFGEVVASEYMDALDDEIDGETDPAKLRGLQKYKEFLEGAGEGLDKAKTTYDDLMKVKKIFIDSYDPSMDIENMKVDDVLKKGLMDRMGETLDKLKFWNGPKSDVQLEEDMASDQLKVYEAMLERQQEIDFLKMSRKDRLVETVVSEVKDKMVDELKDKATDLAEGVAGSAFATVGIVGEALDAVQDEAKKMMFTGLIKSYNRRRNALEKEHPEMDNEELHKLAVQQVKEDPYGDDSKFTRIAQYGNLVENKDCKEADKNVLCIDNHVFWTSMDKSYEHINHDKLFKREMDQLDRKLKKSSS